MQEVTCGAAALRPGLRTECGSHPALLWGEPGVFSLSQLTLALGNYHTLSFPLDHSVLLGKKGVSSESPALGC